MLIDCDACVMRGPGCRDCVVSVLLGPPAEQGGAGGGGGGGGGLVIDDEERAALDTLAQSGLVPPLRLVHAVASLEPDRQEEARGAAGGG